MEDITNFLQENQAFQNLKDFQASQQENLKNIKENYLNQASEMVLPITETIPKVIDFGTKLLSTGQQAIKTGQNVLESVTNKAGNTFDNIQNELKNINSRFSNRMQDVFSGNQQPEDILNENTTNLEGFNKIQSLFKSNMPEINPYDQEAISESVSKALPELGTETELSNLGGTIEQGFSDIAGGLASKLSSGISNIVGKTAGSVGEDIASVAGTVAEDVGLTDLLGPVGLLISGGIAIHDLIKSSEVPSTVQNIVTGNPILTPNL